MARAASLGREGFTAGAITRDSERMVEAGLHLWGPDRLAIDPPEVYDWDAIRAELRRCPECGETDVATVRVAFANRACEKCAPALRAKLETPGWCN